MSIAATRTTISSDHADTPPMPEFNVSNHLLDDRDALDAAWRRDGYWFFRDILDKDVIARARAEYIAVLEELNVVEPGCTDNAIYNGKPLQGYPIVMGGDPARDPLLKRNPAAILTEDPAIQAVFTRIWGEDVFCVPNSEFHAVPPGQGANRSRFNFVHTDGANNKGLPLRVCWIPLAPIDEPVGGLAVAEGLHTPRLNDFARPSAGVQLADVPVDAWRRIEYRPGDLLMFGLDTPHSGLANRSDRYFRLSMDVRAMPKSGNLPVIGNVEAVDAHAIVIRDGAGAEHVFRLNQDTYCRIYRGPKSGMPLLWEEIPQSVEVGAPVYVVAENGNAVFIRPQH